ncbi:MAG: acyl-CoA thioesterase [Pseudomonadota bacterium]
MALNLYFRLIRVLLVALMRKRITSESLHNRVVTRIYPNDLDINLHVNNGRYLTLCDLGRIDLFIRSGLARVMIREKWFPVVGSVAMKFIKPLHVFDRITILSTVTHWDEKYFYSTHEIYRKEVLVSEGTSRSLVVSRTRGRVSPDEVVEAVNTYVGNADKH